VTGRGRKRREDKALVSWRTGMERLRATGPFYSDGQATWTDEPDLKAAGGYAYVTTEGDIACREGARLDPEQWVWVVAHLMLHRGLGHLDEQRHRDAAADAAACLEANRFLRDSQIGREPVALPDELPSGDPALLAAQWRRDGVPAELRHCGTAGLQPDVVEGPRRYRLLDDWPGELAAGIARAAAAAIDMAGGVSVSPDGTPRPRTEWERARGWFVSSYPLLGGLAAQFKLVAEPELARRWSIAVAAVNASAGEIYLNPQAGLSEAEWRFVLAHEMLHAALRHGDRVGGRDPYLWNVAADYVINGWLVEMQVGDMPDGVLFDQALAGQSAESVYDLIATDLRRLRKLATLRGRGLGDILGEPLLGPRPGVDLDEYYRRALCTGLAFHEASGRGLLPSGFVEEVRALDQPPLPWDVQLARWFEEFVRAPEPRRSYARPSRRQASTPSIPRPGRFRPEELEPRSTFGVVIDTSGSMDGTLLGKALGAIASYATARDVPRARVVFCDAAAYDAGYLAVEDIAGRVKVRGRGGTVLQPGVQLLERADDFPTEAPILIITDGYCDVLRVRREHAYLVPQGARLPFTPRGPVFAMTP
jgi:predicted metal-dependent peptidase